MNRKIAGILFVTLLIAIVTPIMATTVDNETGVNSYVVTDPCDLSFYKMNNGENLRLIKSNNGEPASFVGSNGNDDQMDQQQKYFSGVIFGVYGEPAMLAQSFKPTLEIFTRVKARLHVWGSPDGLKISIRDKLNGSDLTSLFIPTDKMPITNSWAEFNFPDLVVTPEQIYYIIWDPIGSPDKYNTFYWDFQPKNPYDRGCAWKYLSETWQKILEIYSSPYTLIDPDFCFKTYGKADSPPNKPSIPSGSTKGNIGDNLYYESYFSDPDGDALNVLFDWDDSTDSGWIGSDSNGTIGSSHSWSTNGIYMVKVKARDQYFEGEWSESLTVVIGNVPPLKPSKPSGENSGKINTIYYYSTESSDPNEDSVYYQWDWGDDTTNDWIGPKDSGESISVSHEWSMEGSFNIKVKAKDQNGLESEWSDSLSVSMPKNKPYINTPFLRFLEQHPHLFPLLRQLMGFQ